MEVSSKIMDRKIFYTDLLNISLPEYFTAREIEKDKIISFSNALKYFGICEPLLVRKNIKNPEKFVLVSGHEYFLSLLFFGIKKVPCLLVSLTDTEAEAYVLSKLENLSSFSIFDKAKIIYDLLSLNRLSIREISYYTGIPASETKKILLFLKLSKEDQKFIQSHNFSLKFIESFYPLSNFQKEKVKSKVITESLSEKNALSFIVELIEKKPEPIKLACLSSDTIIMNSLNRIINILKSNNIDAEINKTNKPGQTEYKITIENLHLI